MGKLLVRIHCRPNAYGNGRQPDRKSQRLTAKLYQREQSGSDAWEMASRIGIIDDKFDSRVHWSNSLPDLKDIRISHSLSNRIALRYSLYERVVIVNVNMPYG